MRNNTSGLQIVDRGVVAATGMIKVAEQGGQTVFDDVSKMQGLVNQYYNPNATAVEKMAYVAQFNELKTTALSAIQNTQYDGKQLIADSGATPLRQVILDPTDVSQTMDISFGASDIADVNSLTLGTTDQATETNAVNTAALNAGNYLAKTTGYSVSLQATYDMNGNTENVCSQNADDTDNIDSVTEAMNLSKQQISQQMSVSMMAQANMIQGLVLKLVGM
jgi:flagellin-like hook-associated protein FlgL